MSPSTFSKKTTSTVSQYAVTTTLTRAKRQDSTPQNSAPPSHQINPACSPTRSSPYLPVSPAYSAKPDGEWSNSSTAVRLPETTKS